MIRNRFFNESRISTIRGVAGNSFRLLFGTLALLLFSMSGHAQVGDFDLALRIYPAMDAPVEPGDIAEFTIEVINQGEEDARNIKLVDYIPDGLQFITAGNTGWSSIGSRAITTITETLPAGETATRTIFLQLSDEATPANVYNYAEISLAQYSDGSDATDDDIDSTPDTDATNDIGADAFTITDDSVTLPITLDEDDHDVALLIICTQNACNNFVNISLNAVCDIEIVADMIIENPAYPDGAYTVVLEDEDGNILPSNMVDGTYVGQTLKVTAFVDGCEGSGCWGYATIEDKFAINLVCSIDTVDCGMEDPESVGLPLLPGTWYYSSGDDFIIPGMNGCTDVVLSYEDEIEMLPCQTGSPYVIKITRTFEAIDGVGNTNSCTSEIYVRKGDLSDIVAPADYIDNPLMCGQFSTLPNGNPNPTETGFPEGIGCPNIIAVYEDIVIEGSTEGCGSFDVIREWTVIDWCNSDDTTFTQAIKIMDLEAPQCGVLSTFYGTTYADECEGEVNVADPDASDNCSTVTYTVAYKPKTPFNNNFDDLLTNNIVGTSGNYRIEDLPVGEYRIAYFLKDACGNESQCMGEFEIIDDQDPTPVCIPALDVTLDVTGNATLPATAFDFGSFDNCGVASVLVKRLNNECNSDFFATNVNFCCSDAGQTAMVQLQIKDFAGNTNICMVPVQVTDDIAPVIMCPADVTLTCAQYYGQYDEVLSTSVFGVPNDSDNCDLNVDFFDTKAFNTCGVGIVVRTWTVEDGSGNEAACKQYFEIESDFDFDENMIQWPNNITLNQCVNDDIPLSVAGEPVLPNESCSNFTVTYDDSIDEEGAGCGNVLRTFTVVDNCALDENNNSFSYTQTINIFENEDPVFTNCQDTMFIGSIVTCDANIFYEVIAEDNCTAENDLIYSYSVDFNNDGTINANYNGNILQGNFPNGTHRAVFRALDECGNEGTCAFIFTSLEDKNPTPICKPISVSLDDDGTVEIWANDFNHKSYDNCTDEADLTFSFSEDINNTSTTFDCFDIPNGVSGTIEVTMYVWDLSGNYDFCTTTITITDTDDICEDIGSLTVDLGGKVMKADDYIDFPQVEVKITNDNSFETNDMSDDSGDYMFSDLSLYDNYTLRPIKNDDALNGITTLDIVRIQKHILGLATLQGMNELVAADVNNDEKINGSDIIQVRKLLLGFYENDELPQNTSWRFYPDNFVWNESYPYDFPEQVEIVNVLESNDDIMFYGIKIGDINASAEVGGFSQEAETRNEHATLSAKLPRQAIGNIDIPVTISDAINLEGFQLALDIEGAEVLEVTGNTLAMSTDNFRVDGDKLYISWSQLGGVELTAESVLFTIKAYAQSDLSSDVFKLGDRMEAELYSVNEEIYSIEWEMDGESIVNVENHIQMNKILASPNPFYGYTQLEFTTPKSGEYDLSIFTVNGNEVMNQAISLGSGKQIIKVDESMISTAGIYYVYIKGEGSISVAKIIKL